MTVQVKDLLNAPEGAFLLCGGCGGRYSANAADYWDVKDSHVFTCCGGLYNALAISETTLTIIKE